MASMKISIISVITVAVSLGCVSANCIPRFRLLPKTTEVRPGFSLVLECSVEGEGSTVFSGNLINCTSSHNEITLLHSRFTNNTRLSGTCNNGKLLGHSLPINISSNCYTSWLWIMVSPDMVGKTVRCSYDNGTAVKEIGNFTIAPNTTTDSTANYLHTVTSVSEGGVVNNTSDSIKATKSLSSGELEAIIICCSLFLVGVLIIVTTLSVSGFMLKKKRFQAVQTLNSVYTSSANMSEQQIEPTFHCAQHEGISGYTICTVDYDQVVVVTDDREYNHLQHPAP